MIFKKMEIIFFLEHMQCPRLTNKYRSFYPANYGQCTFFFLKQVNSKQVGN